MKDKFNSKKFRYICIFSIVTIMFLILYNKFILRDYAYVYSIPGDIGSDTINSYYPILGFISNSIHKGNLDIFTLQGGMGMDMSYLYSYFGNPVDIVAALFSVDYLHVGILFSTYLKLMIIAGFGYSLFELLHKNKISVIASTVAWTFCSFTIIWGQHYVFCTQMMNFTIFMYILQRWLSYGRKNLLLLIPFMSFFLVNNYYFFYMAGIFSAFYVVFFKILMKSKPKMIFIALLQLAGCAILAIGLGMIFFMPIFNSFTNSMRSDNMFDMDLLVKLIMPYWPEFVATDIGRFLNSNIVGEGYITPWTGTSNYYESAFLSTSLLSIYAIIYEILYSKRKKVKKIIFTVIIFSLIIPIFTYFLTFNHMARRWTFCLLFISSLILGQFLDHIDVLNRREVKKVALIGVGVISVMIITLFIAQTEGLITLTQSALMLVLIFSIAYALILYNDKFTSHVRVNSIVAVLIIELIVVSYPSINERGIEKNEQFQTRYQDGTSEAIEYLSEIDNSLYRVSKTYSSVFLNDSLIQNYNGVDSYSSVNPKEAWAVAKFYGGEFNGHPNYIKYDNVLFQNLLGSKYILSKTTLDGLELVKVINNIFIYKNTYNIPFGYMYDKQISAEEVESLSVMDRILTLAQGFTTETEVGIIEESPKIEKKYESILENIVAYINCTVTENDDTTIKATSEDPQFIISFPISRNTAAEPIDSIRLNMEVEQTSEVQIFFDTGQGFNEGESLRANVVAGENYIELPVNNFKNFMNIRLDPVTSIQSINIISLDLALTNQNDLIRNIEKLTKNALTNVTYQNSRLQGDANNESDSDKMLMIPITYSKDWIAKVDDKDAEIVKINNGMIGILIPEGRHHIEIEYKFPYLFQGGITFLVSLMVYFCLIYSEKKSNKNLLQ